MASSGNRGLEVKQEVLRRVRALLDEQPCPVHVGRGVVVGTNSVSRLIEHGGAAVVVVSRDAIHMTKLPSQHFPPPHSSSSIASPVPIDKKTALHSHIAEMCRLRSVPLLVVPKLNEDLSKVFKMKRASCFAIPNNDYIVKALKEATLMGLEWGHADISDSFYGVLDRVREDLTALASGE